MLVDAGEVPARLVPLGAWVFFSDEGEQWGLLESIGFIPGAVVYYVRCRSGHRVWVRPDEAMQRIAREEID